MALVSQLSLSMYSCTGTIQPLSMMKRVPIS